MIIHRRREATPEAAAGLRRGDTIAGYRIERLLGTGGMGAVYEATQLSLRRSVALKLIAGGVPISPTLRERFRREGHLQTVIEHPHILPVYEAGESHGRLFIAMRLVHGPTLKTIAVARRLDQHRSMRILTDVARALDAAHSAGLVHRDVKPQNILLDPDDFAYLADFGLSKAAGEATLTHSGQLLGSIAYMSPEQARGEPATDASDIYSFACVVYECLVGLVPFPRESDHAVLHAQIWDPAPQPSQIRAELPAALDEVIAHGMAKGPEARPRSACAIVREAQAALGLEADAAGDDEQSAYVVNLARHDGSITEDDSLPGERAGHYRFARRLPSMVAVLALLIGVCAGYLATREPGNRAAAKTPTTVAKRDPSPPPAARVRFGSDLNAAFSGLEARKARLQHQLGRARTAATQASALAALSKSYRTARAGVIRARAPVAARAARASIGVALARIAGTYRSLELAAQRGKRPAYDAAKSTLRQHQAELTDALQRLRQLGYRPT